MAVSPLCKVWRDGNGSQETTGRRRLRWRQVRPENAFPHLEREKSKSDVWSAGSEKREKTCEVGGRDECQIASIRTPACVFLSFRTVKLDPFLLWHSVHGPRAFPPPEGEGRPRSCSIPLDARVCGTQGGRRGRAGGVASMGMGVRTHLSCLRATTNEEARKRFRRVVARVGARAAGVSWPAASRRVIVSREQSISGNESKAR